MAELYFDDFAIGDRFTSDAVTVTETAILRFAREFDPQAFHIDALRAGETQFGGLIASGFHALALSFGTFFRLGVVNFANLGSPGIDQVRWLKPLRPGDTIYTIAEVTRLKVSNSKPDRGVIWMRHETVNQSGDVIMTVTCMHMLRRRPTNPRASPRG